MCKMCKMCKLQCGTRYTATCHVSYVILVISTFNMDCPTSYPPSLLLLLLELPLALA